MPAEHEVAGSIPARRTTLQIRSSLERMPPWELAVPWRYTARVYEDGLARPIPRGRGSRLVRVVAAVLLVAWVFNVIIEANSIAVLVWGADPPAFPPTL